MPSEIKEAMALGALGYLAKPFDPMTLVSQINALQDKKEKTAQLETRDVSGAEPV